MQVEVSKFIKNSEKRRKDVHVDHLGEYRIEFGVVNLVFN